MGNFRLKIFRTVADNLNFRQAAEALYLAQPAVTLQIKALKMLMRIQTLLSVSAGQYKRWEYE
jgi:DNA-binding transcriptional LysR family regulator